MDESANIEIERKWLIDTIPDGILGYPNPYIQAYLAISDDEEVRIRRRRKTEDSLEGNSFEFILTCKNGRGQERKEYEVYISAEAFNSLLPAALERVIEKERYIINDEQIVPELRMARKVLRIELDIYYEKHQGLKIAEIEFESSQEADSFIAPYWFGEEVTHDERYKNKNLAKL